MELAAFLTPKIILTIHVLGVLSAIHAARYARTSQGAIAWVFALILFPYFALLLYWIFGPRKFEGYLNKLQLIRETHHGALTQYREKLDQFKAKLTGARESSIELLERLTPWPVTHGNAVTLLVNGEVTFQAICEAIDSAQEYLLIQFYIWRCDNLGNALKERILAKLEQGVKVYCMADSVGSIALSAAYVEELRAAGAEFTFFGSKGLIGKYSINFRNHRKTVVADGHSAFVGGHNIGDEYLSKDAEFGIWRDTHLKVIGPAVQIIQSSFLADWFFATGQAISVRRTPRHADSGDLVVLPMCTGPTTDLEDCSLMFMEAISSAKNRFWIASPYFVPDESITQALQMAALRGTDVRVMLPKKPDNLMVWLASFSYIGQMLEAGVRVYHYDAGFLHQKVFLVDDDWSCVGTANLDNRSLRLNFELSVLVFDRNFAVEVEEMLIRDLEGAFEFTKDDYENLPTSMLVASAISRLASPIL
ncbi:MAG: cardiolipin synthase [Bdellovibrionales bacterium]|nr:cardiolipin synthase [Bdellovibrionales bacterium]